MPVSDLKYNTEGHATLFMLKLIRIMKIWASAVGQCRGFVYVQGSGFNL